ncbi:hypothetical protein HQ576_12415, partial [bacterium]|nr:hypothetical protein [bacterium]
ELQCTATGSSDKLATAYKLTGSRLSPNDADWIDADNFVGRTYSLTPLTAEPYTSTITLQGQATSSATEAHDQGQYTASIIITATEVP